jgi:beta-galactosidase
MITLHWITLDASGAWSVIISEKQGKKSRFPKVSVPEIFEGSLANILPGIQPGQFIELDIEGVPDLTVEETYLHLSFTLRHDTNWAKAVHEVAFGQVLLVPATKLEILKSLRSPTAPQYKQITPQILSISSSSGIQWEFNIVHGNLISWRRTSGDELIHTPPVMDFYRAVTDNDAPKYGKIWTSTFLHQTKCHVRSVSWTNTADSVVVVVNTRIAPPVLEWSVDSVFTYTFTSEHVSLKVKGAPQGVNLPHTFARIGLTFSLNDIDSATWFGRGLGESYRDKKLSQKIGTYTLPIDDLYTPYEFPQESGNRTDTRWVQFNGKHGGLKAYFGELEEASFSALHYSTKDLDEANHPYDLIGKTKKETIVRLDWAHHGLGTGSCGPATLPEYCLESNEFEFEVLLEYIGMGTQGWKFLEQIEHCRSPT